MTQRYTLPEALALIWLGAAAQTCGAAIAAIDERRRARQRAGRPTRVPPPAAPGWLQELRQVRR
jgi:cytochrome c biogenesis factor